MLTNVKNQNKVEWHSSFLEGTSVPSVSVDIVPSAPPTRPAATPQQKPLAPHPHTWQGAPLSIRGSPARSTTPTPHPQLTRPAGPQASTSNPIHADGDRQSPVLQTAGTETQGLPHLDKIPFRRGMSVDCETPMANIAMSTSSHGLQAGSDAGGGLSYDTMKDMTRLISECFRWPKSLERS